MTKLAIFTTLLAAASASVLPRADIPTGSAPALPVPSHKAFRLTPEEAIALVNNGSQQGPTSDFMSIQAGCSNQRTRLEWEAASDTVKQKFVDAVKCMYRSPSKGYPGSTNRYDDFVQVHQAVADNVHNNRKFIVWHRAYLWAFEEALRNECGFTESIPWFDETKFPGRFSQSSVFSNQWFGAINLHGNCVTDGQFANLVLTLGPGTGAARHCMNRNGDASVTKDCTEAVVNNCRAANDYQVFAECEEGSIHYSGHQGTGGTMGDFYASPSDPVFWLHHAMVDRHFRLWQNNDGNRVNYIDGLGPNGEVLTMDTPIYLNGLKPNLKVRDVMDTLGGFLCYRYDR